MIKEFEQAYQALNRQQRYAVDQTDGPLLVIAGPGTGKTQLLSMRIANIIRTTDTRATNILALTYTNKAAVNMKDRIIRLAGQEGARVPASTFHSFAAEIMNLYPDNFWNGARLAIAPESVQLDIVENIVSQLPLDNPLALKFEGQYTLIKTIQRAIGLAKDAGLTPEKLRAIIKFNLAYIDSIEGSLVKLLEPRLSANRLAGLVAEVEALQDQEVALDLFPLSSLSEILNSTLSTAVAADENDGKTSHTSKWKSKWTQVVDGQRGMHTERQRNLWWLELAGVYETYRQELHQRSFYDYADMLVEVISQLEQNPGILAEVQERFNYVLVDEFQDSTPAQLRLAHLVANHYSAEGNPNLMAVGDDDQTIFKFNGAEVNNMLSFEEQYPSAKKIVLTDNYRSSQKILDFAEKIINQADTRLVNIDRSLKKQLTAKRPPKSASTIRTVAYSTSELQLSTIARDIKKRYAANRSIAVLARGHDSLVQMTGILEQLKVAVRYEQAANILDHELIAQTHLVAQLLIAIQEGDSPATNSLIHKILRWPAWGVDEKVLWHLAQGNFREPAWLDSLLNSKDANLSDIGDWFVSLSMTVDSQPLAITIEQIIGLSTNGKFTSPIRNYYLSGQSGTNDYFYGLSAIQLLRNLVHEFGVGKHPTLRDFVRYLDINRQNQIIIADESPFVSGPSNVQLMTVHKAKGLEFDDVYIIDAIDDNWRPKSGGRKSPSNLPLQPAGDDFDDYVRLMYVAATRAKANLTISGYWQDHSGKDVLLSSIVSAAQPFERVTQSDDKALINVLEENLRWPRLGAGDESAILKARLESFNLNVTHLNHFLDFIDNGPQDFKERHLLRLPELRTPSQALGTAIHNALNLAQNLTNRGKFSLPVVQKEFETSLLDEHLPPAEYRRQLTKGKSILKNLFGAKMLELPAGSLSEYELRNISFNRARLSGTLDRVDRSGKTINVADYKTGRPLASFDTRDQNQLLKAYRHRNQLIFYALLLEAKEGAANQISGEMIYVEASSQKQLSLSYMPSEQDRLRLSKLIDSVWQHIQKLNFPDTSGYQRDVDGIAKFEQDLIDGRI